MIRLFEVKLKPGQREDCLKEAVIKKLGMKAVEDIITDFKISGKSIDARNKKEIRIIYNVDFSIAGGSEDKFVSSIQKKNRKIKIKILDNAPYDPIIGSSRALPQNAGRPVIIGFGPAGMFAGLTLAYNGLDPIIIDRGKPVDERIRDVDRFWDEGIFDPDSNPLFGEGGAGTFSDGKLTTGKNDKRIPYILKEFHEAGAPEEILYVKKPHIGTDVLRTVVKNIREKIIEMGGDIRFETKMTGIEVRDSRITAVEVEKDGELQMIKTNDLILAIGHSARDTYKAMFDSGISMEQKPFSIGLRIEHDQALIDSSQYGPDFEKIYSMSLAEAGMPPAEYKLSHRLGSGRGVYTFCMCPGGEIITTAAEEGTISVNGMSRQARNGSKANSALLVDVRTEDYESDHPLAGIEFQRNHEKLAFSAGGRCYRPPSENVRQFMTDKSRLAECLPGFAADGIREALPVFGRKIKGFDDSGAVLKGIESGSSAPVRILRDKSSQSNIRGIYPCGEGAGYAGGITSSAIDGIKCAEHLIADFVAKKR